MGSRTSSQRRRADLIREALRQYVERGIEATTRTSLAAALGVDRVIVHRLYPDLDSLFDDVLDHVRQVGEREIDAAVAFVDEQPDDAAVWPLLLGRILGAARANPLEWQFLFLAPSSPGVAERLDTLRVEVAERIVTELVHRSEDPAAESGPEVLRWQATFLYQGLFGSIAEHLAHGRPGDDNRFVETLAASVGRLTRPDRRGGAG